MNHLPPSSDLDALVVEASCRDVASIKKAAEELDISTIIFTGKITHESKADSINTIHYNKHESIHYLACSII